MTQDALDPVGDAEYLGAPIAVNQSTAPADVLNTTQGLRLQLVQETLKSGKIPTEAKEAGVLLQTLRDLDNAALMTRKIDVEERQLDEAAKISDQATQVLKLFGGRNPFAVDPSTGTVRRELINGEALELPEAKRVPGIERQGTESLAYEDFVSTPSSDTPTLAGDGES